MTLDEIRERTFDMETHEIVSALGARYENVVVFLDGIVVKDPKRKEVDGHLFVKAGWGVLLDPAMREVLRKARGAVDAKLDSLA